MICLISLIVFSILGIFSVSYRKLAKEAFNCVFRRITLRPCDTGFDQKVKAKVVGKLLSKNLKVAKFVSRYFEAISWIFVILLFVSLSFSVRSIYNLAKHKTCNPKSPQKCIFNSHEYPSSGSCGVVHGGGNSK